MSEEKITIELTAAEAKWLMGQLGDWWEVSYSGLDELELFMPLLTIYQTLRDAGVERPDRGGME